MKHRYINQHVEIISMWIDKLVIADNVKNSYEFKLLLRGFHDGLSSDRFHEICDNKSRTVTIKSKESIENHILSKWWKKTIPNSSFYGPSFGRDLRLQMNNGYCSKSSYEKPIRETDKNFSVEECEVFQVIHD